MHTQGMTLQGYMYQGREGAEDLLVAKLESGEKKTVWVGM